MFDPSQVKSKAPEEDKPQRSLGHTQAMFGPKTGPEKTEQPNRKARRRALALCPRSIRELARKHKRAKTPHSSYYWQYLEPEHIIWLKEQEGETQQKVLRGVKNGLKRRRRTLGW